MTKDYIIIMQDSAGRKVSLNVDGTTIDELIASGLSAYAATEEIQTNAVEVAVRQGQLCAGAWLFLNMREAETGDY